MPQTETKAGANDNVYKKKLLILEHVGVIVRKIKEWASGKFAKADDAKVITLDVVGYTTNPFRGFVNNIAVQNTSLTVPTSDYYFDTVRGKFVAYSGGKYYLSWNSGGTRYLNPQADSLFKYGDKFYKWEDNKLVESEAQELPMHVGGDMVVDGGIRGKDGDNVYVIDGIYNEGPLFCEGGATFESVVKMLGDTDYRGTKSIYQTADHTQNYIVGVQKSNSSTGGYQLLHQARANWNNTGDEAPLELRYVGPGYTGLSMDSKGVYVCSNTTGSEVAFGIGSKMNASSDEDRELFGVLGDGSVMAVGSMSATAFNQSSDERLKDIKGDVSLSVDDVASAPMIAFDWKEPAHADKDSHVGTTAQYWHGVLPDVVGTDHRGYLTLDYATAAMMAAITTAREVVKLRHQVVLLMKEIEDLKKSREQ